MFTSKEVRLITQDYFRLIRITEDYYEVQSKNTGHCWVIKLLVSTAGISFFITDIQKIQRITTGT